MRITIIKLDEVDMNDVYIPSIELCYLFNIYSVLYSQINML